MKVVRALVNGEPARSMDDVVPGVELSFDGEVRAGDVVLFGADEYYRATRDASGGIALEPMAPLDWDELQRVLADLEALQKSGAWSREARDRLHGDALRAVNGHTEFLEAFFVIESTFKERSDG